MSEPRLTPAELLRRGNEALARELGVADAIRFINLYSNGQGDYAAERRQLFDGLSVEQLVADIEASKAAARPA